MFQKIKTFWSSFWNAIKTAYNKAFKEMPKESTQAYRDTHRVNYLAVFVSKLNNLSNIESTYDVESDSAQTEKIVQLCEDLENKRFDITEAMLGDGDMWVFPATNSNGELFHRYVEQDKVRVIAMDGEDVIDVIGIIDEYATDNEQVYFLNRRHTLHGDTLFVETYVTNERNERVSFEPWAEEEAVYQLQGAGHIGVGRFKSPASSRGMSPIYGVPLNFGCEEIERRIFNDLAMIEKEFERAESKIFADPLTLRKGKGADGADTWQMPEGVFPKDTRGGTSNATIDIFSPAIRYSEYRNKLLDDLMQYEQQVGVDRGFLTPYDNGSYTNTSEVKRENANTIALIDKIHNAIKAGVEMTLRADAVFLNIAEDLYAVKFDFYDVFDDTDKQYERIVSGVDRKVLERADELKWLFPYMTDEEIEEKLARIDSTESASSDNAINRILGGGQ